jgi:hypothetical protein
MNPRTLFSLFRRKTTHRGTKAAAFAVEMLESRLAPAGLSTADLILHLNQTTNFQQKDALQDRGEHLQSHHSLQQILADGQWVSTHRDINVFEDGKVTSIKKTDGNNYVFSSASLTQLTAVNSFLLSDTDATVHKVNWVVQVNPSNDSFVLRDPTTPSREATGRYDRTTDTLILMINGPAGRGAEPSSGPAWGITTNYYTHVRSQSKPAINAHGEPILHFASLTKRQQADAYGDRVAYLQKQQALQRLLSDGQWLSTHRDINIFEGGKVTSVTKTDGNNYTFSASSPTQLAAVNSYLLSDSDPTIHTVNWVVQVNPFQGSFILRDPSTPSREAIGHYDRTTDTLLLSINGPAGHGAEPTAGPAWGITTNFYTHIKGKSRSAIDAHGEPLLHLTQLTKLQQADASRDSAQYLRKQQALQQLLSDGQWLSSYRDINVFEGGKATSIAKTDGNNYAFSASSPTQLAAVNSYVLSDSDPTVHQVNWVVQINPFQNSFILRDPSAPSREAVGRYLRKTDTFVLMINGPAGRGAEPTQGPVWGITSNYYTHLRSSR